MRADHARGTLMNSKHMLWVSYHEHTSGVDAAVQRHHETDQAAVGDGRIRAPWVSRECGAWSWRRRAACDTPLHHPSHFCAWGYSVDRLLGRGDGDSSAYRRAIPDGHSARGVCGGRTVSPG